MGLVENTDGKEGPEAWGWAVCYLCCPNDIAGDLQRLVYLIGGKLLAVTFEVTTLRPSYPWVLIPHSPPHRSRPSLA